HAEGVARQEIIEHMHLIALVFLRSNRQSDLDNRFAQHGTQPFEFLVRTNPHPILDAHTFKSSRHGVGHQHAYVRTFLPHIGLEFLDPAGLEILGAFALIIDFAATYTAMRIDYLDTVATTGAFFY